MRRGCLTMAALLASAMCMASPRSTGDGAGDDDGVPRRTQEGLTVFADAGVVWADDGCANFYSGRPGNANTIDRVLHSNTWGARIWDDLHTNGLISPAIGSYNELRVAEYADMYYRTSYHMGIGLRYGYASGFGWMVSFDMTSLEAIGAFNLDATNGSGAMGANQYVRCGLLGEESRTHIDLALTRTAELGGGLCLELDLGVGLNNTKVKSNLMEINGTAYSILDVWGGRTPDAGVGDYEYVNQGGIGWGVFMSGMVGYRVAGMGAIKAGYTCRHSRTTIEGYSTMGWQHCLTLRLEINNFSFL